MTALSQAGGEATGRGPAAAGVLPQWLGRFWGVAAIVALYRIAYSIPIALASPALGMDNVADNVWAQQLRLVYQLRQPPLFEWLLWPVQRLTGPNAVSFLIVKDALMTLTAVFLFGAARYAIKDRRLAAVAVLSYGLFYNVAWTMLERLTQSSLLLCCCAAAAWTFVRALRTGRTLDYALLGAALGAGLIAKFNFALFGLGLVGACLAEPTLRRRLRPAPLTLSLLVAAAIAAPFVYGVAVSGQPVARAAVNIMEGGARAPYLARVGQGLSGLALSLVEFSLALVPLALLAFWKPLATAPPGADAAAAHARLFGRTSLIAAALAAIGIVASGSIYVRDWHVLPVFAVLPLWLFARVERGGVSARRLRLWPWIVFVPVAACASISVAGALVPDAAYCGRCGQLTPYPALARDLETMGAAEATLVVLDPYTAGNLRAQLPKARIVMPGFAPTRPAGAGLDCVAVWETGTRPIPLEAAIVAAGYPRADLAGSGADGFVTHYWPRQWLSGFGRSTTWGVRRLNPNAPVCR
ncbi:MAG TPA: glycosyltransferase family 39 protein [Caulobacteraceae bacterium]|nr:glycosyltransferase family 39 protein [Caulobacteraceae bacterium]